jgi:hypothetical protein
MEDQNVQGILSDHSDIITTISNLVIGRVFKRVYLGLDENGKKEMEEMFLSGDDKEKERFIKKHIPNFKKLFDRETEEIEGEISKKMKEQFGIQNNI